MTSSEQFGQYTVPAAQNYLSLRCGQPATYYLKQFNEIFSSSSKSNLILNSDIDILQYGKKDGFESFKTYVQRLMYSQSLVNDVIPNEHIYMTNGVTQAVQIITSYLSSGYLTKNNRPITALYIEELTYFLIKMHLEDIKIPVKTFSFNKLDDLSNQMDLHKNFNEEVAFYIIPFCHNPTGLTLKEHTINNFLNIIDDSIVLSDETYLFLSYGQTQYKSLYFYQKSNIIAMHTFSKIMAPGLRLGYILCKNKDIIEKLNNSGFMRSGG